MHVPYETEKFYYGFPVYILAYPDEAVGVGITTGSSSYSLGQMVMIGCDSTTHAARAIKRSGVCSLNLFGAEAMGLFEYAGTVSGGDKLRDAQVPSSDHDGIPVLDGSQMSLLCRVLEATDDGTYTHFRCEITGRLVDSALIDDRGRFRYEDLRTVEYVGDAPGASTGTSRTGWSVLALSCARSRSLCSPSDAGTQRRPGIHTQGPRPRR